MLSGLSCRNSPLEQYQRLSRSVLASNDTANYTPWRDIPRDGYAITADCRTGYAF